VGAPDRFRADVEGLRAVAILAVALYPRRLAAGGGYAGHRLSTSYRAWLAPLLDLELDQVMDTPTTHP
jgi:peptidoglycan/LPS O-acetylase OafA/YrhL